MSLKCVNSISEFDLVRFVSTVHEPGRNPSLVVFV